MKNIQVFDFEDNAVRVVDIDGEPWFVAADVARVLDFRDAYNATRVLDDDEKGTHNVSTPSGDQEMTMINESGLYHLVLVSRKPEAKKFRKWVTAEVLPSIRKTGMYVAPEVDVKSADEVRGRDDFADLPNRTFQQWINLVRETRLLYGRAAARSVWESSPLPTPQNVPNAARPVDGEFSAADGAACLAQIVDAAFENGEIRGGCGVRFYELVGVRYLFVARTPPVFKPFVQRRRFRQRQARRRPAGDRRRGARARQRAAGQIRLPRRAGSVFRYRIKCAKNGDFSAVKLICNQGK